MDALVLEKIINEYSADVIGKLILHYNNKASKQQSFELSLFGDLYFFPNSIYQTFLTFST